jgi:hypothetical protein
MFITWTCFDCGEKAEKEYKDTEQKCYCPKCEGLMIPDNIFDEEDNDNHLAEVLDKEEAESIDDTLEDTMRDLITYLGDKEVWETLEQEKNFQHRAIQRQIFIKVGGLVPDGEAVVI